MMSLYSTIGDDRGISEKSIYIFEQFLRRDNIVCIREEHVKRLKTAMRAWDAAAMESLLYEIVRDITSAEGTVPRTFGLYTLIQLLYEMMREKSYDARRLSAILRVSFVNEESFVSEIMELLDPLSKDQVMSIDQIIDYINTHYKENTMGLDTLAAQFNMSVSSVSKYIKEKSGQKYTEYVVQLRIQEACRLLQETELSVQEITYEVGYNDYASFSKKFKLIKGVAPSEYRRLRRE